MRSITLVLPSKRRKIPIRWLMLIRHLPIIDGKELRGD
jgi:hypothetical protein